MERHQPHYILLDRDGTVIEEKNYLSDPSEVTLLPGAAEGLQSFRDTGFRLVLITNQSGIGRGYFSRNDLDLVHERLRELLAQAGITLDGIYICPHAPNQACECRKPKPKLALDAACEFGFDLRHAWMIGDKAADVGLARNCGAGSVLVRTGYGAISEAEGVKANIVADNLLDAAQQIRTKLQ